MLEGPEYYHLWAHQLKTDDEYVACATGHCRGEPDGRNHMPAFEDGSRDDRCLMRGEYFYTVLVCVFVFYLFCFELE